MSEIKTLRKTSIVFKILREKVRMIRVTSKYYEPRAWISGIYRHYLIYQVTRGQQCATKNTMPSVRHCARPIFNTMQLHVSA